ncbi:MAG: hypothetical protein M3186_17585 [Actinomycetota bacterium]|nr:hypothetical protein [Actinomycetota bacterium]
MQELLNSGEVAEQISHALRCELPNDPQAARVAGADLPGDLPSGAGGLPRDLTRVLRIGRRRRKPHRGPDVRGSGAGWTRR